MPRPLQYATLSGATGIAEPLARLLVYCGQVGCLACGSLADHSLLNDSTRSCIADIADRLHSTSDPATLTMCASIADRGDALAIRCEVLQRSGIVHILVDDEVIDLPTVHGTIVADSIVLPIAWNPQTQISDENISTWLESAIRQGGGQCFLREPSREKRHFQIDYTCQLCHANLPILRTSLLTLEELDGRCTECAGLGQRLMVNVDSIVRDPGLSLSEGAITPWATQNMSFFAGVLHGVCSRYGIDMATRWSELSKAAQEVILYGDLLGDDESDYLGVVADLQRRLDNPRDQEWLSEYTNSFACDGCNGSQLSQLARSAELAGYSMAEILSLPTSEFLDGLGQMVSAVDHRHELAACLQHEIEKLLQPIGNVATR